MPNLDPPSLKWPVRVWSSITRLNFYRIHLIYLYVSNLIVCFACWPSLIFSTVTPLIFSAIFYASNGRYHVAFIDALFNCFSSMCVCRLATGGMYALCFSSVSFAGSQLIFTVALPWSRSRWRYGSSRRPHVCHQKQIARIVGRTHASTTASTRTTAGFASESYVIWTTFHSSPHHRWEWAKCPE